MKDKNLTLTNMSELSSKDFELFLRSQKPKNRSRTRTLGGEKSMRQVISVRLTRQQWQKVLIKCNETQLSYGSFVRLLISKYFGLPSDLDKLDDL